MKRVVAFLLAAAMMVSLTACGNSAANSGAGLSYKAGTYEASEKGMNGDVTVSVAFTEDSIESVEVLSHSETEGLSDPAIKNIPADIVKYQSLGVDMVSGATFTSKAILGAVAACVEQAGGDAEALKAVPVNKEVNTEPVEKTADVVILGGGGAGLSAAIEASQNGSSVILIERNAYLGGNTVRTAGATAIVNPEKASHYPMTESQMAVIEDIIKKPTDEPLVQEWQKKVAADMEAYKKEGRTDLYDSVEFTALQFYFRFGESAIPERLYEMVAGSSDLLPWLSDMGFPWTDNGQVIVGDNWPRWYSSTKHKGGNGYIETMENHIKDKGLDVEIIKEVRGQELITEGDRVVGVKAVSNAGQPYTLHANKGVILATGGFAANTEMLQKYSDGRWDGLENLCNTNDPAMVGDGIVMAEQVNAQLYDMGHLQILPIADPVDGNTKTVIGTTTGLYINKEGVRFVDETSDRDTLTRAIMAQPDSAYYLISCESNNGVDENGLNIMGVSAQKLLDDGKAIKADTLEELAEKMGVDPAVFEKTVADFNTACQTGVDEAFGRTFFGGDTGNTDGTPEIKEGPYYATLRKPAAHITKGGILIDEAARVLGQDNEPIEGLFAAGEVTGGTGVAGLLNAMYTGRIAGQTVSAAK